MSSVVRRVAYVVGLTSALCYRWRCPSPGIVAGNYSLVMIEISALSMECEVGEQVQRDVVLRGGTRGSRSLTGSVSAQLKAYQKASQWCRANQHAYCKAIFLVTCAPPPASTVHCAFSKISETRVTLHHLQVWRRMHPSSDTAYGCLTIFYWAPILVPLFNYVRNSISYSSMQLCLDTASVRPDSTPQCDRGLQVSNF